jgi:hypothetical protein
MTNSSRNTVTGITTTQSRTKSTRRVLATLLLATAMCVVHAMPAAAQTATISLASGAGVVFPYYGSQIQEPSVEVSLDGGATWAPAYATQDPWGDSPFEGATWIGPLVQPLGNPEPQSYRISFFLPAGFTSPSLEGISLADDQTGAVVLNGTPILSLPTGWATHPLGSGQEPFSTSIASLFRAGTNVLQFETMNLGSVGGITFIATVSFEGGTTGGCGGPAGAQLDAIQASLTGVKDNGFVSKLQSIRNSLAAGNTADACGSLKAFTNLVRAQSGKRLTEAHANELLAAAACLARTIGC